jgi:hypothetical protein
MATARSALLSIRALSQARFRNIPSAYRSCPRCNARQYSDRPDVKETESLDRSEDIFSSNSSNSISSSSGSNIKQLDDGDVDNSTSLRDVDSAISARKGDDQEKEKARKDNADYLKLLLQDDVHVQPDLRALDELKPRTKNVQKKTYKISMSTSHSSQEGVNFASDQNKEWDKTLESLKRSFTAPQLEQLCKDARVPVELFKFYGIRHQKHASKVVRARILMVHRFKMEDPTMSAKRAILRKQKNDKTRQIPTSQLTLLLLALRAQSEVQKLLQYYGVKMRPMRKTDSEGETTELTLSLQGSQKGIDEVEKWIANFREVSLETCARTWVCLH